MDCKINYIDNLISDKELADKLTQQTLDIWNELKDSNLFTFKNSTLVLNKIGTNKRIKQDTFIKELNEKYQNSISVIDGLISVNLLGNYKQYSTNKPLLADAIDIIRRDSRFSAVSLSDSINKQFKPIRDKALADNDYNLSVEDYDKLLIDFLETLDNLNFYHVYDNPQGEKVGLFYIENDPNDATWSGWNKSFTESVEGMKRDAIQVFGEVSYPKVISYEGRFVIETSTQLTKQLYQIEQTNNNEIEIFPNSKNSIEQQIKNIDTLPLSNTSDNVTKIGNVTEIQNVYDENNDLKNIGTIEEYTEYLNSIFPNSKFKDIVYHGGKNGITEFKKGIWGDIYFSKYSGSVAGYSQKGKVYKVLLDIENPHIVTSAETSFQKSTKDEIQKNNDSVIDDLANEIIVFEPSQAHILGSDNDIEKFKNYKNKQTSQSKSTENLESQTKPRSNEEIINQLKETLKEKYPEFRLETVDNLGVNGLVDFSHGIIQIKHGRETALSEEMAHLVLELHPEKKSFYELAATTKLYQTVYEEYKHYPHYWKNGKIDRDLIKEETAGKLLAEAIYAQSTGDWSKFEEWVSDSRKKDFIKTIRQWLAKIFNFIRTTDFDIFKQAAKDVLSGNIYKSVYSPYEKILLQIDKNLEASAIENLKRIYDTVEFVEETDPNYESYKGQDLLNALKQAGNILRDNLKLVNEEQFKGKAQLPTKAIEHAQNLIDKVNVNLADIEEATKSFILTMEGVQKFAKFSQQQVNKSNVDTIIKISRFTSQWKFYLDNLVTKNNIDGELYEFIRGINYELDELEKKVYEQFKGITTEIFVNHLKPLTEPIRIKKKAELVATNNLWNDDRLFEWLNKYGEDKWNQVAEKKSSTIEIEQKIISLGKLENKKVLSLLDSILANTYDNKRITDIITGKGGDVNSLASLFYGASSSRDAILAAFQHIVETSKVKAVDIARDIVIDYMEELQPLIAMSKLSGVEIGKRIMSKTKRLVNGKELDTYEYLNDVTEYAYIVQKKMKAEVDNLPRNTVEWKEANKKYQKWMIENFYQDYKPSYFEALDDTSDIGIEVKRLTTDIWSRIRSKQELLESLPWIVDGLINPEREIIEEEIEEEYLNYKRLFSEYKDGKLKDDSDDNPISELKIAKYLSDKTRTKGIFEYQEKEGSLKLSFNRFYDEFLQIISPEEHSNPLVIKIKDEINSDTRDLAKVYELIEQLEFDYRSKPKPSETLKWAKKNIQRIYTQDFFDDREAIFKEIQVISAQLNVLKNKVPKTADWQRLHNIIKPYKDIDRIVNGKLLSELEIKDIKDFQESLEAIKKIEHEQNGHMIEQDFREFNRLKKELFDKFKELEQLQSKETTPYYTQMTKEFIGLSGEEFLISLEGFNSIQDYVTVNKINNPEFVKWFNENHFQRITKYSDENETIIWIPIYAWTETKPKNPKYINYRVAPAHNRKIVTEEYIQPEYSIIDGKRIDHRDAFGRWKPREIKYNKDNTIIEPTGFRNEEYYRLKNSNDSTDKALFKILEILKTQHVKAQFDDGRFLNTYKLYYYIPQKNREKFEDLSKTVNIVKKRFTQQVQEEGGSNFNNDQRDETIGEMSKELNDKGIIGSFFSGVENKFKNFFSSRERVQVSVDFQNERYFRPALGLYNHIDIEELSQDILLSQAKFIEESKIHQAFNEINPKVTIIYKTLKQFKTGEKRVETYLNIVDREIQGINKLYEVGETLDKVISGLKSLGNLRSQTILNPKGAIKNALAGTGNLWVNKSLISDSSLWKAEKDFMSKYYEIKSQLLTNKPKSKDFKIFEYFIPRIGESYKYYMADKFRQTLNNASAGFSLQEEGELQLYGVTLELFLESSYKGGKLRDFILVETQENGKLKLRLKDGTYEELIALKNKFAELMRLIQGNQGMQKAKTETGRSTVMSAIMFYRNYLPYTLINRFSTKRTNFYLNEETEGYYVSTFLRVVPDLIKDLSNIRENFSNLSPMEKENFYKVVKELSVIVGSTLVLFLLGYSDLDKDRFKKMKDNNYFHNLLLYEILSSYNEIAGLSPLRGFGFFEEASGNVTKTSMAFGEIGKVIDVLKDFSFWIVGSEEGIVQKNSAFAKKGDVKWINDLKKLFPLNNLTGTFSNEKLVEQIKNYVLQLERN